MATGTYKTSKIYEGKKLNQNIECADRGGCLKFFRPLELIGIYVEIKNPYRCSIARFASFRWKCARVLKFHIWIPHEKLPDKCIFSC